MRISVFWFRRDLRIENNVGLSLALSNESCVLPLFIFDQNILDDLPSDDPRVSFIYECLEQLNVKLRIFNSSLQCLKGDPIEVWGKLIATYDISRVYANKDYEPYARERDREVEHLLAKHSIAFRTCKDQVIHEEFDVLKNNGSPYTVFTPYRNKWLSIRRTIDVGEPIAYNNLIKENFVFPKLTSLGFVKAEIKVKPDTLEHLDAYARSRDFPGLNGTTLLGPHLRFGTISIRKLIRALKPEHDSFLNELIWREFFMQILFHFPHVVTENFRSKYDHVEWLNNSQDFEHWCRGETGYPLVDAGMRQLNTTGYMHNRVRMVTASFLCKHLLIDWRLGEAYFAEKLLDYELSSNNGNWQWAAGTGCDAAPYFRIFNPTAQLKKFDKSYTYVKKWVAEFGTERYRSPIVDHDFARKRALDAYRKGLAKYDKQS
jgi:deoxyribodipyrimidine photo-lyase